jgi:Scavenger receptor cysteine-rich domain/LCCL domain
LACTDFIKGNDYFGPNYVTPNVNYMNFLAECPSDCHRSKVRAVGLGIHPEESPICINAIVDRAISFYGGIISISLFKGLPSYTAGKKIYGIPVMSFGISKKSYTIAKVDNIDMIYKDVRIVDSNGLLNFKGRLEMRNEGIWGTICARFLDDKAAKVICKQVGYKGGKFLNPTPDKGRMFCKQYEGLNWCGAQQSKILFSSLRCQGNEDSIFSCFRESADQVFCNHDYDTLIECSNVSDDDYVSFQSGII